MSWDDLSKNHMEWPSVREVNAYRAQVYAAVAAVIREHPALDDLPVTWVSRAGRPAGLPVFRVCTVKWVLS